MHFLSLSPFALTQKGACIDIVLPLWGIENYIASSIHILVQGMSI